MKIKIPLSTVSLSNQREHWRVSRIRKEFGDFERGFSRWIRPVMGKYFIECCDCGLVHEAQFYALEVVKRYKNGRWTAKKLPRRTHQVMFRMRRAERYTVQARKRKAHMKLPRPKSRGEETFALQIRAHKLAGWEREFRFHPERRWRFDFAHKERMLAVEVHGAVHRIKERFRGDAEKELEAFRMGWRVLRVSTRQVVSGDAIAAILEAVK